MNVQDVEIGAAYQYTLTHSGKTYTVSIQGIDIVSDYGEPAWWGFICGDQHGSVDGTPCCGTIAKLT